MVASVVVLVALTVQLPTAPTARVNYYANLLSAAERQRIESDIATREQATGTQMAIAIFRALADLRLPDGTAPSTIEELSIRLAEKWRIGQKGLDNGIILIVLVDDRKLRFEVGYGLEGVVPDITAGRIISEVIAPRFRERRYAAGLEAAVQDVYSRIEAGPGKTPARGRKSNETSWPIRGFAFLIVVVLIILGMEASRSRRFVGRRGYTSGGGGWGVPIIFPGGFGGGGGGSGGSGGGFSGGGGSFGGGGASGSW